jgi:hypothetical protein
LYKDSVAVKGRRCWSGSWLRAAQKQHVEELRHGAACAMFLLLLSIEEDWLGSSERDGGTRA